MPLYEQVCLDKTCPASTYAVEHYYPHQTDETQACDVCGGPTAKLISVCHAIWLKPLGEYNDPKRERFHETREGHWMYKKRSTSHADGSPEPVFIRTRQDQRRFCADEGYAMPDEIGDVTVSSDGRSISGQGMAGQWV